MSVIEATIVSRLLRQYLNECGHNYSLWHEGDISVEELEQQLFLLDTIYSGKIVSAVLE